MLPLHVGSTRGGEMQSLCLPSLLLQASRFSSLQSQTPSGNRVASGSGGEASQGDSAGRDIRVVFELEDDVSRPRALRRPASILNHRGQGESGDPRRFRTQAGSASARRGTRAHDEALSRVALEQEHRGPLSSEVADPRCERGPSFAARMKSVRSSACRALPERAVPQRFVEDPSRHVGSALLALVFPASAATSPSNALVLT